MSLHPKLRRYAPPALFILTALVAKLVLRDFVLEQESPFILFFSAVLLSAWWGGLATGVTATVVCATLALTLFLRTAGEALHADELIRTAVFLGEGIFVSFLAEALQRSRRRTELALSEQQAAMATLAEEEERFRFTFEQAAVGMAHVSLTGQLLRVNDRLCEITGYTREELFARTFQEITHPDDAQGDAERAEALLAGTIATYSIEKCCIRKDGRTAWIQLTVSLAHNANGLPLYFIDVIEDIDARKEMESALRVAHQRLTYHINNSPLGAILWDRDFRIASWSPQCERIFGWPAEEVLGRHPREFRFIHEDDQFEVGHVMAQLQSGTRRNVLRNRNYTREGKVVACEWYNSVIFDSAGMAESIQSLVLDVSDRARAEDELRQLTDSLEHRVAERTAELKRSNAELESFAYVASHDLQEPLRMVASYTQLLARRYGDKLDADAHDFIGYAVDGVRRMQRLINDLLAYSRIERRGGELAAVAAASAVEAALANLQPAIEESGARIDVGELPRLRADEVQLTQLFQNLIGNAIKFRGSEPPRISITAEERDDEYEFTVRDNGIGIEPAFADRIFVIFQRLHTRAEYPGTGIGLALCKKIVERHGGRIWLDTAAERGAVFKFTFPATARNAPPAIAGAA